MRNFQDDCPIRQCGKDRVSENRINRFTISKTALLF